MVDSLQECGPTVLSPHVCEKLMQMNLRLHPSVVIANDLLFRGPCTIKPSNQVYHVKIDAYSYIGTQNLIVNTTIGRYCSIACNIRMGLGIHNINAATTSSAFYVNENFLNASGPISIYPQYKQERGAETNCVNIGHDVWIGDCVIIPADVTIGHGAVIGAGTIVTKDVPPFSVVVNRNGHGEVIKTRLKDEDIADIMALNWWDYDLPSIVSAVDVVYRKLANLPLYEPLLKGYYKGNLIQDEAEKAAFDERLLNESVTRLSQVFGITEFNLNNTKDLMINYEDPKAFISYLKSHDLSKFPKITSNPFLRIAPKNVNEVILKLETDSIIVNPASQPKAAAAAASAATAGVDAVADATAQHPEGTYHTDVTLQEPSKETAKAEGIPDKAQAVERSANASAKTSDHVSEVKPIKATTKGRKSNIKDKAQAKKSTTRAASSKAKSSSAEL